MTALMECTAAPTFAELVAGDVVAMLIVWAIGGAAIAVAIANRGRIRAWLESMDRS